MKTPRRILALFVLLLSPSVAFCAGLPPWQFNMTKQQVASFKQFGPYKTFSNGDLETYKGIYHGHKENVQFFFQNNRLVRIGVYFGETTDRHKAVSAFRRAYGILEKDYGKLNIPEKHDPSQAFSRPGAKSNADIDAIAAAMNADLFGQTEAIPARQPKDMRVVGGIYSRNVQGTKWFYIAIYFEPR